MEHKPFISIQAPLDEASARKLESGDRILLSGTLYTLRDAGHQKLIECLKAGKEPPFPLEDAFLYYVGPSPATRGRPIGSAGPTTASRMDPFTPYLIERGLRGMIGKGHRDICVIEAMKTHGAVYFAATGGAGALLSKTILKSEIIAWEELGPEAMRRLEVRDMPLTVIIDSRGRNLYEEGPREWRLQQGYSQ